MIALIIVPIIMKTYPWRSAVMRLRDYVIMHVLVQNKRQVVFPAAQAVEVIHVDSPRHCARVPLRFDPIHFDLHALRILVSHPLRSCESRQHKRMNEGSIISHSIFIVK
jgi:hypothetical protein